MGAVQTDINLTCCYSLSNDILADEKLASFHQYLRYCHKLGSIEFNVVSTIFLKVGLFEYVIYS